MSLRMCVHVKERVRVRERGGGREREGGSERGRERERVRVRLRVLAFVCVGRMSRKVRSCCICRYLPPTIAKVAGMPVP